MYILTVLLIFQMCPHAKLRYEIWIWFFPSFQEESNRGPLDYEHDVISTMLCAHRQKFEPAHMLKSLTHAVAIDIVNLVYKLRF